MQLKLSWENIDYLGSFLPFRPGHPGGEKKVFGVPRGGAIVARMFYGKNVVDTPEQADIIVDDIVDSGKTRELFFSKFPDKLFVHLWEKKFPDSAILLECGLTKEQAENAWIQFPWEESGEKDLKDTVVRQLQYIGEDPNREGLKETPRRVIKALGELTAGYSQDPKAILKSALFSDKFEQMVIVKHIPFWSLCEHHMLPFHGTVSVAYIPSGKIVGLSKIPRVVEAFSRRLQVQERLTNEIAQCISEALGTDHVGVHVAGYHTCMAMRGVKSSGNMVTNALLGSFKDKAETRGEFLAEIK